MGKLHDAMAIEIDSQSQNLGHNIVVAKPIPHNSDIEKIEVYVNDRLMHHYSRLWN